MVQAMLGGGHRDPRIVAGVMQRYPEAAAEIVTLLHQTLGNRFVQAVMSLVAPGMVAPGTVAAGTVGTATGATGAAGAMRVTAHGLHVRSTPDPSSEKNIVGTLSHDEVVHATGHDGGWVAIEHHARPAFVFGQYVEPVGRPAAAHGAIPAAGAAATSAHAPELHAGSAPPGAMPTAKPVDSPDPAHVADAPREHKERKDHQEHKAKHAREIDPDQPFSHSGGDKTHVALTKLHDAGKLKISARQIAQLDAISKVETDGFASSVDTTDDQVVSIGFEQVVLGHKSIEAIMQKVPAPFAKHGLELDTSKTYDFASKPHQIKGVPHQDELRGRAWGMRFYDASTEPEVIAAIAEFALGEIAELDKAENKLGATSSYFDDDTARAWILELHNNRPGYTPHALRLAIGNGAQSAKDRDHFLDILGAAIVDTYEEKETAAVYRRDKQHYLEAHKKTAVTPDEDIDLLEKAKAEVRRKGTNIITKISRHLAIPKLAAEGAAPASGTASPTIHTADTVAATLPATPAAAHPGAGAADHHDHRPAGADHPGPEPSPTVAHEHPTPDKTAHHETAAAPTRGVTSPDRAAPTPVTAGQSPLAHAPAVSDAPKHVDGKAADHVLGLGKDLPTVHAFLPPGGVKESVEVFLFLHGMFAHHNRPGAQINDPNPEAAMKLAAAMGGTARNLVTLAPAAHMSGEWPLWSELANEHKGFKRLIDKSLKKLHELGLCDELSVGSISIAGHSAGGSALGEAASQLGDTIHDMTIEDGGYADLPGKGNAWEESHHKVAKWLLGGESDKLLRVLLHGEHNTKEGHILHSQLNAKTLEDLAHNELKLPNVRVTREDGNHDARTPDKSMYLDHRLHVSGLAAPRTVLVFSMPGINHMELRNLSTQHLITESRGTEFAAHGAAPNGPIEATAGASQAKYAHKAHVDTHAKHADAPTVPEADHAAKLAHAPHADAPTPVHPHAEASHTGAASGAIRPAHDDKPGHYDKDKNGLDSYGNATERKKGRDKNVGDDKHRVFTNQFTVVKKAPLLTASFHDAHAWVDAGTPLHVMAVNGQHAQVITDQITVEHNRWIEFSYLGGHGASSPALGNEKTDALDKQRADALRATIGARLGDHCRPGHSKFQWQFDSGFKPSWDGVALDGSLMAKVNALMEWAIANDMVTGNIVIKSGMRSPQDAQFMALRFRLAKRRGAGVDMKALKALPDGRYLGHKFYEPGWTDEQIFQNAQALYGGKGTGQVAAPGYPFADPRRSPIADVAEGVSAHCSGHAVDVDIPWRTEAHPDKPHHDNVWAWEEIYHQFGLTRPLHRDRGVEARSQESWHLEETGKDLHRDEGVA